MQSVWWIAKPAAGEMCDGSPVIRDLLLVLPLLFELAGACGGGMALLPGLPPASFKRGILTCSDCFGRPIHIMASPTLG